MGDVDGADDNRLRAIYIAQLETDCLTANGYFDDLPYRTIRHVIVVGHETLHYRLRGCRPSAHPVLCRYAECDGTESDNQRKNSFHLFLIVLKSWCKGIAFL